jgi:acyl carrier protein
MQPLTLAEIERAVTEIWAEFVPVDGIEPEDDFFDLGGTSLALISVVMRMGERFRIPLDTSIVVEGATVASLARCVRRMTEAHARGAPVGAAG